ncbi:MAG: sigma-70 family RNA polymerase sigma factor [Bacteroidota bacterium]|nr:sigma-70 family RNA polymerase sigma factor [Bacteroidota bacterium]
MSFEEIYKTYWQKVFRLCMGYVNDQSWAKDIAQDTFVTVWQQLPKFRNESAVGTWVFRIASNQCLRQIEKQNRLPKTPLPSEIPEATAPNIESKTQFLYKCISELPETERVIISLELEDMKQAQIAAITGLSEANVRVKIHRIKEKLTQKFRHYEQ